MALIALITSEMAGRIHICCELGVRLEQAGHTVVIGSPAPIGDRVSAAGLTYVDMEAPTPRETGSRRRHRLAGRLLGLIGRLGSVTTMSRRQDARASLLGVDEFTTAMERNQPDLVLIDLELGAHLLAARSLQLNVAGWTSMLSVWKRPGLPPLGSDIIPGRGLAGSRLGIEWAWLSLRAQRWIGDLRLRLTRVGEDRVSVLRRIAHRFGVSFRQLADRWQWLVPFVPRDLPTIVFNASHLEFPHEPLPSTRYVGPMIGIRPGEELGPLEAVIETAREGALVYASFGAWDKGDDREFLARLVEVARIRPEWTIVVGLGGRRSPAEFGDMPDNLHLLSWAPQTAVLQHADVAIHHAGISSVNECLRAGVPMVVYPFDFLDQPGNAARVEFHGLGIRGDRHADTPDDIVGHIERALSGPFREQVRAMSAILEDLDQSQAAVAAVTALLSADHQSPSAS